MRNVYTLQESPKFDKHQFKPIYPMVLKKEKKKSILQKLLQRIYEHFVQDQFMKTEA